MSQKVPELDIIFFTDTGEKLPEVYSYLTKLEGYLGKQIIRLNLSRNFQHHLKIWILAPVGKTDGALIN